MHVSEPSTAHSSAPPPPSSPAALFFLASGAPPPRPPPPPRPSPATFSPAADMPPRRWSSSGYRGVRVHSSEDPTPLHCQNPCSIRSGGARLGLETFENAHEATRVYDAAAWRLSRTHSLMNFDDVWTCEQAQELAAPPRLVTNGDRREHRRQQRRLLIVEPDEQAMAEWRQRYPEDVADENAFWAKRRVKRRVKRADMRQRKALAISQYDLGQASFFDDNDPRWEDEFLSTSDDTSEEEDDSE
ncbi:uncharacterized protein [Aegilops tauschii subsp. strangulata]|uniref:uncharacterized protein n=1 Tax=Aegilops tauschii subsp. strangulata TaxID=200361 RepID=UPI00098AFA4E|nr:uncharacterized protein LOC109739343 [Aegilops tauschii subsp. strangulata]